MTCLRRSLIVLFLLVGIFTMAVVLQPRASVWARRAQSTSVLTVLLGESRRLFANHFYVKADVSFHSGYYPTIFDDARKAEEEENAVANQGGHGEAEHEEKGSFLGEPTDWIDRFGRHFKVTEHTHLEGTTVKEILPWLRISAELDPHHVDTYTTAAFWLRTKLGKVDEAEQFLREGLRANPDSYEILYGLGQLAHDDRHDNVRAKNLWLSAIRRWKEREPQKKEPDVKALHEITLALGNVERDLGENAAAIQWLEVAKTYSPNPDAVQKQIDAIRAKMTPGNP
jgi:tetratricopeptide (TPR) repeat protein